MSGPWRGRRVKRVEDQRRQEARHEVRRKVGSIPDQKLAALLFPDTDDFDSTAAFAAMGLTNELLELAVGPLDGTDYEEIATRLRELFRFVSDRKAQIMEHVNPAAARRIRRRFL